MTKYFRADGLVFEGTPLPILKTTNLPFIGATWAEYGGLVWHLSEEAMFSRTNHPPYHGKCHSLKMVEIDPEKYVRLFGLLVTNAERYQKYKILAKRKFTDYDEDGMPVALEYDRLQAIGIT